MFLIPPPRSLALAALAAAAFFAPAIAASEKAGIASGCTLMATLVADDCEIRQLMTCEQDGSDVRRLDIYVKGQFRGREKYVAGLLMTEWRRGRHVQEIRPEGDDAALTRIAGLTTAADGEKAKYRFVRVRRKLPAKTGESTSGQSEITRMGPAAIDFGGAPMPVEMYRVDLKWTGGGRSRLLRYVKPGLLVALLSEQENYDDDGNKLSASTDRVVAVYEKDDPNFGLLEPKVEDGLCKRDE